MPELPEVETTIRGLRNKVLKRTFIDVWTDFPKMIKEPKNFTEFKKRIKNRKIEKIWRAGKNIIFDLSGNLSLLIHQKLTGHLLYGKWELEKGKWQAEDGPLKDDPMNRFLHLIFWLDNGWQIALSDLRKFAKIELWNQNELKRELSSLGPDPLEISFKEFKQALAEKRNGKIKQVLMDQTVISGIGNIYSDEILFAARVHPLRQIQKLKEENFRNIYQAMEKTLKEAIKLQGESISDYRTLSGEKGGFDKLRKVYRREKERCSRCGTKIERVKIGGRSAHYCPKCQKLC